MTVNELAEEITTWQRRGYGSSPVLLMNLNTQEHQEAEEINPISLPGRTPEQKAIEIR